jgi:hypothetical protein
MPAAGHAGHSHSDIRGPHTGNLHDLLVRNPAAIYALVYGQLVSMRKLLVLTMSHLNVLTLTTCISRTAGWRFRHIDRVCHIEHQTPRPRVSATTNVGVHCSWYVWCRTLHPWTQCLRHDARDEEDAPLCSGKGRLPSVGDLLLRRKSPSLVNEKRNRFLTQAALKTRFPERRYPGYFDLCGSHSIFHILVVCAAVVQMIGYLDALDYSHRSLVCSYR